MKAVVDEGICPCCRPLSYSVALLCAAAGTFGRVIKHALLFHEMMGVPVLRASTRCCPVRFQGNAARAAFLLRRGRRHSVPASRLAAIEGNTRVARELFKLLLTTLHVRRVRHARLLG